MIYYNIIIFNKIATAEIICRGFLFLITLSSRNGLTKSAVDCILLIKETKSQNTKIGLDYLPFFS